MKRITIRPGKSVVVSDEALARARGALAAFGVRADQLTQLAAYKGDVTIGKAGRGGKSRVVRARTGKAGQGAASARQAKLVTE
ncbi:hypothetical protein [Azohydromonas aeria]|uniref:hypothetical protein n=1 Tax=Azohydromonas aeria TaxID=2590212 RepID=UPI0012FB624B|nr:hypothetical protein [Azohydromonas aeria]